MFKYNNTHIFTGYLKQLLSSNYIPTCKIYTREFARYAAQHPGQEDPRVLESFDTINTECLATRVNYLKADKVYNYFWENNGDSLNLTTPIWKDSSTISYHNKNIPGLTKTLYSPGNIYDFTTHEYLGEYLRFLRDYFNVNLMSLYNCFSNRAIHNIYKSFPEKNILINTQDLNYIIYAIPVKLFADYTIAIECAQSVELFCGFYNTALFNFQKNDSLIKKTFVKVTDTHFSQPFIYNKLNKQYWTVEEAQKELRDNSAPITRWDMANYEKDLKLFIKIPAACKSSIVVLEGNYLHFNDSLYIPSKPWRYEMNHSVLNFNQTDLRDLGKTDLNADFTPISRLQLLAFNTQESYPFADRLIEYLCGSAVSPLDEIPDNIKRAQKVMNQNGYYFKVNGLWENQMQKILYDYVINSGPVIKNETDGSLMDLRQGYHKTLGHTTKSQLYDILGYVDKDTEKWYASWTLKNNTAKTNETIQNANIYGNLYDE